MAKKRTRAVTPPATDGVAGEELSTFTFDQVVEGLLKTPAKRLRQQISATKKKVATKKRSGK